MEKKQLSSLPAKASASKSDKVVLSTAQTLTVGQILSDLGIANGIYFEKTLAAGEEVSIGTTAIGLYLVNTIGNGVSALYHFGAFLGTSQIINQTQTYFSSSDTADRICLFRKSNSGSIFAKNNTASARGIRIIGITTSIG